MRRRKLVSLDRMKPHANRRMSQFRNQAFCSWNLSELSAQIKIIFPAHWLLRWCVQTFCPNWHELSRHKLLRCYQDKIFVIIASFKIYYACNSQEIMHISFGSGAWVKIVDKGDHLLAQMLVFLQQPVNQDLRFEMQPEVHLEYFQCCSSLTAIQFSHDAGKVVESGMAAFELQHYQPCYLRGSAILRYF